MKKKSFFFYLVLLQFTWAINLLAEKPLGGVSDKIPSDTAAATALPAHFNWCDGGQCTPVKNQGSSGLSWAYATCAPLEIMIKIKDDVTRDLAESFFELCVTDSGGLPALKYFKDAIVPGDADSGAVYGEDVTGTACNPPYPHHEKIKDFGSAGYPDVAAMKQAIYQYGPITASVCANSAFMSYASGVFTGPSCTTVNHCVVLTGWDETTDPGYWYLRNSWGTSWGENGYMRIKYGVSNIGYGGEWCDYPGQPDGPHACIKVDQTWPASSFLDCSTCDNCTIVKWLWNFGDSTTSTMQNCSHTYSAPGTYTITLTVTSDQDPPQSDTASYAFQVFPPKPQDTFAGSFSGAGLWVLGPANTWAQWNQLEAQQLATGDFDGNGVEDPIGTFASGLWIRFNTGNWQKIEDVGNPTALAAGDLSHDGKADIIGSWSGIGVWLRVSGSNTWQRIHEKDALLLDAADFDGDAKKDLVGVWDPEGVWIKYATGQWKKLLSAAGVTDIATEDVTGDYREDLLLNANSGVWYYNPVNETWAHIFSSAEQITAGNLDGDTRDDLIGTWKDVPGVWVRYSSTSAWKQIHPSKPTCFTAGLLK